jgi:hypothetical protein
VIYLEEDPNAMTLLRCCSPLREVVREEEFKIFWDEVRSALVNLGADEQGRNCVRLE